MLWPGFTIEFNNQKIGLKYLDQNAYNESTLKPGDEILSCDGIQIKELIKQNVFRFRGKHFAPRSWYRYTPYLMIDEHNPFISRPKKCTFIDQDKTPFEIQLKWKKVNSLNAFKKIFLNAAHQSSVKKSIFLEAVPNKPAWHWLRMDTFSLNKEQKNSFNTIINKIANNDIEFNNLIIDIRHNGGGNSQWGTLLLKALFGESYYQAFSQNKPNSIVDYRASKDNLKHWQAIVPKLKEKFGKDSDIVLEFSQVAEKMRSDVQNKVQFTRMEDKKETVQKEYIKRKYPHNFQGKNIYAITSFQCGSACLGFMDGLVQVKGLKIFGTETAADTNYMDIRQITLPSGLINLYIPTKVYRQRIRKNNEYYTPDHKIDINQSIDNIINDIEAIEISKKHSVQVIINLLITLS